MIVRQTGVASTNAFVRTDNCFRHADHFRKRCQRSQQSSLCTSAVEHTGQHSTNAEEAAIQKKDQEFMIQALELARRGLGKTAPNPAVGCVIVKSNQVVGTGYHPKAGEPHAEVFALRAAGQQAEGATAYVTLEPCNHYGRTPPCSQALVAAKVARVVVGVGDPNPLVGGAGIATLEKAGISVSKIGGQLERDCYDLNPEFMRAMEAG